MSPISAKVLNTLTLLIWFDILVYVYFSGAFLHWYSITLRLSLSFRYFCISWKNTLLLHIFHICLNYLSCLFICTTVLNFLWQSQLCNSRIRRFYLFKEDVSQQLFKLRFFVFFSTGCPLFYRFFMVKHYKCFPSDWCQAFSSVHVVQCAFWCKGNHAADSPGEIQ